MHLSGEQIGLRLFGTFFGAIFSSNCLSEFKLYCDYFRIFKNSFKFYWSEKREGRLFVFNLNFQYKSVTLHFFLHRQLLFYIFKISLLSSSMNDSKRAKFLVFIYHLPQARSTHSFCIYCLQFYLITEKWTKGYVHTKKQQTYVFVCLMNV